MDEQQTHITTHLTPDPETAVEASRADGRTRRSLRALALDLTPLKQSRDYRLLFTSQSVSFFGSMMSFVTLPWQMYQLTHSSLAVGLLGVAEFGRNRADVDLISRTRAIISW